MVDRVSWLTIPIVSVMLLGVTLAQPALLPRSLTAIAVVLVVAFGSLLINRSGSPRVAAWFFVVGLIALITYNAALAGGVRSPGIQSWFILVMLAGLLLGWRAAVACAVLCALLGLGLVAAEGSGLLPAPSVRYDALSLWFLTVMYIGIALVTMRVATGRVTAALARANAELGERRTAETRLARALDAGQIGVFDQDLATGVIRPDERTLRIAGLDAEPGGTVAFADWFGLIHPDDRDSVRAILDEFAAGRSTGRTRYRLTRPDGALRHIEAAAHLSEHRQGVPSAILGMVMDVTEQKDAQEERERLVSDLGERVKDSGSFTTPRACCSAQAQWIACCSPIW